LSINGTAFSLLGMAYTGDDSLTLSGTQETQIDYNNYIGNSGININGASQYIPGWSYTSNGGINVNGSGQHAPAGWFYFPSGTANISGTSFAIGSDFAFTYLPSGHITTITVRGASFTLARSFIIQLVDFPEEGDFSIFWEDKFNYAELFSGKI